MKLKIIIYALLMFNLNINAQTIEYSGSMYINETFPLGVDSDVDGTIIINEDNNIIKIKNAVNLSIYKIISTSKNEDVSVFKVESKLSGGEILKHEIRYDSFYKKFKVTTIEPVFMQEESIYFLKE